MKGERFERFSGIDLSVKPQEDDDDGIHHHNDHKVAKDFFRLLQPHENEAQACKAQDLMNSVLNSASAKDGDGGHHYDQFGKLMGVSRNTASDRSTVEDYASPESSDRDSMDLDPKNEVTMLQREITIMTAENQKLKFMLSHLSNNYANLQMHLTSMMPQPGSSDHTVPQQVTSSQSDGTMRNNGRSSKRKVEEAAAAQDKTPMQRQFLDIRDPSKPNELDSRASQGTRIHDDEEASENCRIINQHDNKDHNSLQSSLARMFHLQPQKSFLIKVLECSRAL